MEFRSSAHPTGWQAEYVCFTTPTSADVSFIPSPPTVTYGRFLPSSPGMPTHGSPVTSAKNQTLATHASGSQANGPNKTLFETPIWTTGTGSWTSPMHPTPQPPHSPDPNRGYPATVSTLDGSILGTGVGTSSNTRASTGGSISGNVAMLTAIPTVVCVSLGSAIYFFWRRARRNRWQKSFRTQLARRAIEARGNKEDSACSSTLEGKEVVR